MYTHRKLADLPIRKGRGPKRALEPSEDEAPPPKKGRGRPKRKQTEPENAASPSLTPVKKGRGRPKKDPIEVENVDSVPPVKRGKGRPKKEIPETENVNSVPAIKRGKGRPKKVTTEPESPSLTPVKKGRGRPPSKRDPTTPVKKGRGRPPKKQLEEEESGEEESEEEQSEEESYIGSFDLGQQFHRSLTDVGETAVVAEDNNSIAPTTPSPFENEPPSFATEQTSSAPTTLPTTGMLHDENYAGLEESYSTKVSKNDGRRMPPKLKKALMADKQKNGNKRNGNGKGRGKGDNKTKDDQSKDD
ncbi:MAG: hypothetical protein Q9193_003213 [Seirophora villosa]